MRHTAAFRYQFPVTAYVTPIVFQNPPAPADIQEKILVGFTFPGEEKRQSDPRMDAVTGLFQPIGEQGSAALCGSVFKVEYTDCGQRRVRR